LALLVTLLIGGLIADRLLLMFAWPQIPSDGAIVLAVATYAELASSSWGDPDPLLLVLVCPRVDVLAAEKAVPSIFQC
jgi:hypothetical protein